MEENKNKEKIKEPEKENKSPEKAKKTLLKENKAENKDFTSFSENLPEKENKAPIEEEKTEWDKFLEQEGFESPQELENAEKAPQDLDSHEEEQEDNLEEEDLGFDLDDLEDIPEGEDLFDELVEEEDNHQPRTKTAKEIKEKLTSSKNAEILEKASLLALNKVDLLKAKLCSKISGQHFVQYLGDEETLLVFMEALKAYLEEKEFKEPSPFATLMLTLGMWALPPLGIALLERFEVSKLFSDSPPSPNKTTTQETTGEAASDQSKPYAHLKEFQQQRKKFSLNADGKYNHTPNGKDYIHVEYADEFPSPIVKQWIEEGKKNKEIIKLLNYG